MSILNHRKIFLNQYFGYTKVTIEQPTKDEKGKIVKDKSGNIKPNNSLRDYERIPLLENIDEYFDREVKPHLTESWMDRDKDKVGYEINFTKYFYKYTPLRSLKDITNELLELETIPICTITPLLHAALGVRHFLK